MFQNVGVPPKQKLTTFRVTENAVIKPGNIICHVEGSCAAESREQCLVGEML